MPHPSPTQPDNHAQGGTWWTRLRQTLARAVAGPTDGLTNAGEHQRLRVQAIRDYHHDLTRRSQAVLDQRIRDGWWLGPAPHGYKLSTCSVRDNGKLEGRHRLVVDSARAATVPRIFAWVVHNRLSDWEIANRLNAAPDHYPRPVNHITGQPRPFTPAIVRTIRTNPAYLGYTVRCRTHHGRPVRRDEWIWSTKPSHPALIGASTFWAAHLGTSSPAVPPRTPESAELNQRGAA